MLSDSEFLDRGWTAEQLEEFKFRSLWAERTVSRKQRAFHEAGHAIEGMLRGDSIRVVTLTYCAYWWRNSAHSLVAGLVSEYLFDFREELWPQRSEWDYAIGIARFDELQNGDDLQELIRLLLRLNPNMTDNELIWCGNRIFSQCHDLLSEPENIEWLRRVADRLVEKGELSGAEVGRLMLERASHD